MRSIGMSEKYIRWFETLGSDDVSMVGGKNASLGEILQGLEKQVFACQMVTAPV
jgi:phosphoenolpyruvate synthase/pyruvate phosphate dikinase